MKRASQLERNVPGVSPKVEGTVAALVQLPLTFGGRLLRKAGLDVDAAGLAHRICSGKRMAMVDRLDQKTKRLFVTLYGWNLFVAMPTVSKHSSQ